MAKNEADSINPGANTFGALGGSSRPIPEVKNPLGENYSGTNDGPIDYMVPAATGTRWDPAPTIYPPAPDPLGGFGEDR
jgi:hypothetical protein